MNPTATLDISPRRQLVREIAFDKQGRPYGKVRAGWREDAGGISYRPGVVFFPEDLDELEKVTGILDSPDAAAGAPAPSAPDLAPSGKRFCFHLPARPGKRAAVVASFRVSQSGKPLRMVELYVYQNEGQQVLAFLKDLRDALAEASKSGSMPVVPPTHAEVPAQIPPTPVSIAPAPLTQPAVAQRPSIEEEISERDYDLSDFENELLERFDSQKWQSLVEEKGELERRIFLDDLDEVDRKVFIQDLERVLEEMNEICAANELDQAACESEE